MAVVVLEPPAGEPVALAEAKLALRIDQNTEDALVSRLIAAAREAVEALSGLALITRRVKETRHALTLDAEGFVRLWLAPVSAVHAVRIADGEGAFTGLDPETYALDQEDFGRIRFLQVPPAPGIAANGVEIEYQAGFGDAAAVPEALTQALTMVAASIYEARLGEWRFPDAAKALVRPYQRVRL